MIIFLQNNILILFINNLTIFYIITTWSGGGIYMEKNIGNSDRIFRFAAGFAIIIIGIAAKSWWGIIGIVPIITASISHCPVYLPFGINTCKLDKKD